MNEPPCPACDRPLTADALVDGWCPACGKRIPEFVRAESEPPHPVPPTGGTGVSGWLFLALLVVVGGVGGVLFGMARHGALSGWWVLVPVLIYAALYVGRWVELGRRR